MKNTALLLIILLIATQIFASLVEESLFISKLYEDKFYDLALREIARIENRLENDRYSHQILAIKADILLQRNEISQARDILIRLNTLSLTPALKSQVMFSLIAVEKALNNYSEAFDLVLLYESRFPDSDRIAEVHQIQSDLLFEQGNYTEAGAIYETLHQNNKSAQTFLNLIRLDITEQKLFEAELLLHSLHDSFPRNHDEYQNAMLLILTAYEHNADYVRILEIAPARFENRTDFTDTIIQKRIVANINLRNFNEAELLLLQIHDDTDSVNYYKALIHKERGEDHMALPIFRSLSQRDVPDVMRTMSFFNMVQIIAKTNTQEAYDMLLNFLLSNPDQEWEGDILYQLAFIEYQNDNFTRAYDYTLRALDYNLNEANKQRAIYLKGELEFLLGHYENSYDTFFNSYELIPDMFKDEAVFKMGLTSYFLNLHDRANTHFNRLINDFSSSQKIGTTYFYLGEIQLFKNPTQAKTYYHNALSGDMDRGVISLRLAYADYLLGNYSSALNFLNQVPETDDYMFDKYLLRGVVLIAQNNFSQALEAFRTAERNSPDQVSLEFIWSRQALLHYNMQNYDAAMTIYRRLATESDTPGMYILSAAGAAFNADNFHQAIELYNEHIKNFSDSPDLYRSQLGLANSYYNLGLYELAIDIYRELVNENQRPEVVEASLKGLQDSYIRLNRNNQFIEFLHMVLSFSNNSDFLISVYEFKANFEYEIKNYNSSVATINQMLRQFPEKREDLKIMIMLANNYTWLNRFEEADQIYITLSTTHNDPFIYFEWGHIKWAQGDQIAAIRRYKRSVENNQNEQYWLNLLEKLIETKDDEFLEYYEQFVAFASEYHQNLAKLYLVDWQIYNRDYTDALANANELLEINNPLLRARVTYKLGEIHFALNEYEDAISNFLRIRYFFSEYSDIRWAAELFIARIYVMQGERDRGIAHFESIKANLTPEQIAEFRP